MHSEQSRGFTCDLSARTVLVTGASSGIGAHLAAVFAAAGADVVAAARREERLSAVVSEIRAAGGSAAAIVLDVADPRSVDNAFVRAEELFGKVDVLVNNAGIAVPKPALDLSVREWDDVVATNLRGAFLTSQAFARHAIRRHAGGAIVNVGSIMGERVAGELAPYAASKAGLHHLTRALALEWARYGIRVNAVAPGYIETQMNAAFFASPAGEAMKNRVPQRRLGTLRDLEAPMLLLASDASSYITGVVLPVDGGHLVSTL